MKIAFVYNEKRSENVEEAEFDTADTIKRIASAIGSRGDSVSLVEMTKDGSWITQLAKIEAEMVFNTAEGYVGLGREAYAPTVFEQLGLHYVGSGPYACFLTLDKFLSKKVVEAKGVPVADGYFISSMGEVEVVAKELEYPVFVKPNFEGSSKGITRQSKCNNQQEFTQYAQSSLQQFPQGLLVEKYISGRDITIPFINGMGKNGVLEPLEYTGTEEDGEAIYDYQLKNYEDERVGIRCPAEISKKVRQQLMKYMELTVNALGINDMARADFRITDREEIFFIEVNALPSLQEGAGIFAASALAGLDYDQTIQKIIKSAQLRNLPMGVKKLRKLRSRDPLVALVYNVKRKKPGDQDYEQEAEFDSQETIEQIQTAIQANGYQCNMIEANRDLSHNLQQMKIDVVFNIAEGMNKKSREAQVPALCDLLGIEHTGSDATCLSLTLNKALSTKIVGLEGIKAPASWLIDPRKRGKKINLKFPIIIKPNLEGSSKGIYQNSVVKNWEELEELLSTQYHGYRDYLLAEEYISGREFTVGVIGANSLKIVGISEMVFSASSRYPIYSYELKQVPDPLNNPLFKIISPPDINQSLKRKLSRISRRIFTVAGCRDVARIDFRVDEKEDVYFIEINPLPGLTPGYSDLPILAQKNGMEYSRLIGEILKPAIRRWRKQV